MGSLSAHAILVATIFELAFMTQEPNVATPTKAHSNGSLTAFH
jgi:hypothetical protein